MSTYDIRKRALAGQPSYGLVMCMDDLFIPEMAYHAGFHFVKRYGFVNVCHFIVAEHYAALLYKASRLAL